MGALAVIDGVHQYSVWVVRLSMADERHWRTLRDVMTIGVDSRFIRVG